MQGTKQQPVFHPLLFALNFPGMVIVSNIRDLSVLSILLVLSLTVIATSAVWYLLQRLIDNIHISAFFASLAVTTFYLYGQLHILLFLGLGLEFVTDTFLFGFFATIFLITIVLTWRFDTLFSRLTRVLNFVSIVFVFSMVVLAIPPLIRAQDSEFDIQPAEVTAEATGYEGVLPDVYLIVLDAYPRADVFEEFSGEEAFLEQELEQLGFTVATDSKTNYLYTQGLLPALLNFNYLPDLIGDKLDPEASGTDQLDQLIQDNAVCKTFKSIGYKVVTFNSTFGPTRSSKCADQILSNYDELFELANIYTNTTILRPIFLENVLENLQDARRRTFEHVVTVSEMEESTFMFAHILLPHSPYIFDENGDLPPNDGQLSFFMSWAAMSDSEIEASAGQTIYTAKLTVEMIQQILENSEVPPIIIVQSDHGPDFKVHYDDDYYAQRIPILNAYYLPNGGDSAVYPSISPVNSFRAIFNYYFGADLEILDDRTFVSRWTDDRYYDFHDITTRTLAENDQAHIGVDWDDQFYEISSLKDDKRELVLRVYRETISEENTLVMETTNGWLAEFTLRDSGFEITVMDGNDNTVIDTVTQLNTPFN